MIIAQLIIKFILLYVIAFLTSNRLTNLSIKIQTRLADHGQYNDHFPIIMCISTVLLVYHNLLFYRLLQRPKYKFIDYFKFCTLKSSALQKC